MLDTAPITAVTFAVPGKPFGKQRPRATRQGRVYTPKETVRFEQVVAQIAVENFPAPFTGPVRLTVIATFAPAASWSRKKREGCIGSPHVSRPDLDNCIKGIADALNRVAWADDGQVAEITARKQWGTCDGTLVTVEAIG